MDNLEYALNEMHIAKSKIEVINGFEIDSFDFQLALCEKLYIDSSEAHNIVYKNLSNIEIIDLLKDYNFAKNNINILGKIELEESILPNGIERLLTEQTLKVKGEVWIIHNYDIDPFPSSPHAHNYDSNISLDLGTGEFFNKRQSKGFLDCKKLKLLRDKISGHKLPKLDSRCE
jgi:hypothetical protein